MDVKFRDGGLGGLEVHCSSLQGLHRQALLCVRTTDSALGYLLLMERKYGLVIDLCFRLFFYLKEKKRSFLSCCFLIPVLLKLVLLSKEDCLTKKRKRYNIEFLVLTSNECMCVLFYFNKTVCLEE